MSEFPDRWALSVNLAQGMWRYHGCGAKGGPYEAAIAHQYSPRSAIDLLVAYALAPRRGRARVTTPNPGHCPPRRPSSCAARPAGGCCSRWTTPTWCGGVRSLSGCHCRRRCCGQRSDGQGRAGRYLSLGCRVGAQAGDDPRPVGQPAGSPDARARSRPATAAESASNSGASAGSVFSYTYYRGHQTGYRGR